MAKRSQTQTPPRARSPLLREIDQVCQVEGVFVHLRIAYHQVGVRSLLQSRYDLVTVDIAQHTISANS